MTKDTLDLIQINHEKLFYILKKIDTLGKWEVVNLEIKLPASVGSEKKQENSRKTSTSASLTMVKALTV